MKPRFQPQGISLSDSVSGTPSVSPGGQTPLSLSEAERQRVDRLLTRLRRRDPVRQLVEKLLRGEEPPFEETLVLYKILGSDFGYNGRQVELAAWALGHVSLTPPQRQSAAELLGRILKLKDWPNKNVRGVHGLGRTLPIGLLLYLVLSLGGALPARPGHDPVDLDTTWMYLFLGTVYFSVFVGFITLPVSGIVEDSRLNRVRAAAARTLGLLRVPESADVLAETLLQTFGSSLRQTLGSYHYGQAVSEALPPVLLSITPEHYGRLPAHTIPNLCRLLKSSEESLILDILDALEKVGDGSAVVPVERLAKKGRSLRVRDAAERILPTLRLRQQQENASKVLLRAATSPQTPVETLLRPAASGAPETDPQQLLRAGTEPNSK